MNNMSEFVDSIPSFFDSSEEKKQKKELLHGCDIEIYEQEIQTMNHEDMSNQLCVNASLIYDNVLSFLDTEEIKESKKMELETMCIGQQETDGLVQQIGDGFDVNLPILLKPPKAEVICGTPFNWNVFGNFDVNFVQEIQHVHEVINEQNQVISSRVDVEWEVEIICMGKTYLAKTTVQNLLKETEILKITQGKAYVETGKEEKKAYKRYLNERVNQEGIPKKILYEATGWITLPNGRKCYLTDKGAIGHPEMPIYADVPYKFEWDPTRVGTKGIFDAVFLMRRLCPNKSENSTFLTHFMTVSVLTTLFQECGRGINFITAVIGATNSQKTSLAMVYGRMFDRTNVAIPDIRFNSTEVAIIEKMGTYGDAMLIVDDFLPYTDRRMYGEQMKKSEALIRGYGDRVPRKVSKTFSVMTGVPEFSRIKGCCLITGEVFDTNSESSSTRVIQLDFQQGEVDLGLLKYFQQDLLNVPTFLFDFICYIEENLNFVYEVIQKELDIARNQKFFATGRFNDTFGIFSAETLLFYDYACKRDFLSQDEAEQYRKCDLEKIAFVIQQNEKYTKVKSPATLIFCALLEALEKGVLQYRNVENIVLDELEYSVIDGNEYVCVLPETLWKVYSSYCKGKGIDIMYLNGRTIAAPLKKENALLIKEEQQTPRSTHKLPVGSNKRFFFIKKTVFKKLCKNFQNY